MSTKISYLPIDIHFISVKGNIGSGKSLFTEYLRQRLSSKAEVITEPVDEWQNCNGINLLDLYYKDPTKYAFQFLS